MTLTWYRHFLRNGGLNQILKRQTSPFHYGSKEWLNLPEHMISHTVLAGYVMLGLYFSVKSFVDHCLCSMLFFVFWSLNFDPSSIYCFWLPHGMFILYFYATAKKLGLISIHDHRFSGRYNITRVM